MDAVLETLVASSPSTVAVIIVTILFLRYLERAEKERGEMLKHMGDECHAVQRRSAEALDKNTETLGRASECLRDVETQLARLSRDTGGNGVSTR